MAEPPFEDALIAVLPRLRRFGRALTGGAEAADDLVQSAVERALRARDGWRPDFDTASWMFRIMQNLWIDQRRAEARRGRWLSPDVEPEEVGDDAAAARGMEAGVEARRVLAAISELPEEQRAAVALVLVEGLGYREAADALQVPMGTLTSRVVRGRQALIARLGSST